jgi:hypothetical protein
VSKWVTLGVEMRVDRKHQGRLGIVQASGRRVNPVGTPGPAKVRPITVPLTRTPSADPAHPSGGD